VQITTFKEKLELKDKKIEELVMKMMKMINYVTSLSVLSK